MRESNLSWQKNLAQGFASSAELLSFLEISLPINSLQAEKQFKTRVPRGFAARMQKGNLHDPLLRQVLAIDSELDTVSGYTNDPLQEMQSNIIPGLIHKYQGRVLLILSGACAINCRYCFRRHFPYEDNNPGQLGLQDALNYIRKHPDIHEVILSGGDPLLLKDSRLNVLLQELDTIEHLTTLRIHSRIPVVLPMRINADFIKTLHSTRLKKVMVLHSNHPNEIDESVQYACLLLKQAGVLLLNQSVLLAGVNDDAAVLASLSRRLFACDVLPYYLHLLDNVNGAAHFSIEIDQALSIYHELQRLLPGYLVPKLAREDALAKNKTLLN